MTRDDPLTHPSATMAFTFVVFQPNYIEVLYKHLFFRQYDEV